MKRILFVTGLLLMALVTFLLNRRQKSDVFVEEHAPVPAPTAATTSAPPIEAMPVRDVPDLSDAADAFRRHGKITPGRATDALYVGMPRDLLLTMRPDSSFGEKLGGRGVVNGDDIIEGEWYFEKVIV